MALLNGHGYMDAHRAYAAATAAYCVIPESNAVANNACAGAVWNNTAAGMTSGVDFQDGCIIDAAICISNRVSFCCRCGSIPRAPTPIGFRSWGELFSMQWWGECGHHPISTSKQVRCDWNRQRSHRRSEYIFIGRCVLLFQLQWLTIERWEELIFNAVAGGVVSPSNLYF